MKKKILAVDNSPLMLELMTDLLVKEGHQVFTAEDGLAALDILKTYIPDVVFIDLIMPNIDGKKLCQIIRGMPKLKNAYIVILSATAAEEKISLAELGAHVYIAKGKFNEIAPHILAALDQSGRRPSDELTGKVIGFENVYPREITRELLSTKRHFEIILGSMSEGILEITSEKRIVYANPTAISLIAIPEEKLLGTIFVELFNEPDCGRIERLLETMDARPQTITEESPLNLNGKQVTLSIIPVSSGEDKAIIILNDVSERKRTEEELRKHREHLEELVAARTFDLKKSNERLQQEIVERKRAEGLLKLSIRDKEVLLRELHHRTKNNMQVISSLLNLQSGRIKDQKAFNIFQDSQNRIKAMSLIHETLYQSKDLNIIDFREYVIKLVHGLYGAYRISGDRIGLQVNIEKMSLGIDSAIPCGLVINELVSNSLKHAFPKDGAGTIIIMASLDADNHIDLVVSDDGVGIPDEIDFRATETLGLQLAVSIIEEQLGGTIEHIQWGGTKFRIRFKEMQCKERI